MKSPSKKKKVVSVINLVTSISILVVITSLTRTEFILPPFLATAATKYPDPDWRRPRSFSIIASYVICSLIGVAFSLFHLYGLVFASVAAFLSFTICVVIDIEHPPAILATFLGVLEKVGPLYILHPVLTGVVVIEGVNYIMSKYGEQKL